MNGRRMLLALAALMFLCPALVHAQTEYTAGKSDDRLRELVRGNEDEAPSNLEIAGNELRSKVEESVQTFAQGVSDQLEELTTSKPRTWVALILMFGFGVVMLLLGWSLLRSFTVPLAPVWGLILGGATSYFIVLGMADDGSITKWTRLGIIGAGSFAGVAMLMFSALRAKPIAAMLVIMTPFIVGASFLFSVGSAAGLPLLIIGFIAGFCAMIQMRPLAILSTSFAGACSVMGAYGIICHAVGADSEQLAFLRDSFTWILDKPLMLLLVLAVITMLGISFQHSTGPRGTLED